MTHATCWRHVAINPTHSQLSHAITRRSHQTCNDFPWLPRRRARLFTATRDSAFSQITVHSALLHNNRISISLHLLLHLDLYYRNGAAVNIAPPSPPPMEGTVDKEKLAKLQRMAAGVRVGGKGSVRRKKKAVHKAAPTDDKRLQTTLKRLQLSQLPGIEEVNIFKDNGSVINFQNPKVQAQISANTYVISGAAVTKPLQEMLPSIVNQLGADNMPQMKSLMDQLGAAGLAAQNISQVADASAAAPDDADDDEIPDLVDNANFEDKAVTTDHNPEADDLAESKE